MRVKKNLIPTRNIKYKCELEECPKCKASIGLCNYRSGIKIATCSLQIGYGSVSCSSWKVWHAQAQLTSMSCWKCRGRLRSRISRRPTEHFLRSTTQTRTQAMKKLPNISRRSIGPTKFCRMMTDAKFMTMGEKMVSKSSNSKYPSILTKL